MNKDLTGIAKPCPMCGSKKISLSYGYIFGNQSKYTITCNKCYLTGYKISRFYADEKVIQQTIDYWNTRSEPSRYKHQYNEDEVKKLAEERNITEAKARYLIYQRDYGREYRKKNKKRLSIYHKKWDFENRERISLQAKERYRNKKEKETDGIFSEDGN